MCHTKSFFGLLGTLKILLLLKGNLLESKKVNKSWQKLVLCSFVYIYLFLQFISFCRSNNFYFALLLTMLFLCVLPVGYAIVWVEPSWHCGPFSGYKKIYHLATKHLTDSLPDPIKKYISFH